MLKITREELRIKCEVDGLFSKSDSKTYNKYCNRILNGNLIEIGSFKGLSLWCIKETIAKNNITAWSVDNEARLELVQNTKKWGIQFIHQSSVDASKLFQDNFFNLVFIDATHDYENVKNDIIAWHPKVKKNGFLMGHDYDIYYPGLKKAVDELIDNFVLEGRIWIHKKCCT